MALTDAVNTRVCEGLNDHGLPPYFARYSLIRAALCFLSCDAAHSEQYFARLLEGINDLVHTAHCFMLILLSWVMSAYSTLSVGSTAFINHLHMVDQLWSCGHEVSSGRH